MKNGTKLLAKQSVLLCHGSKAYSLFERRRTASEAIDWRDISLETARSAPISEFKGWCMVYLAKEIEYKMLRELVEWIITHP